MKNYSDALPTNAVTILLQEMETDDERVKAEAKGKLLELIYPVLQQMSRGLLRPGDRAAKMFNPSDVVNEAVVRLLKVPGGGLRPPSKPPAETTTAPTDDKTIDNRSKLFAFIAEVMRNVVMDKVRKEIGRSDKSKRVHVSLGALLVEAVDPQVDLLELDEVLLRLKKSDPVGEKILVYRFWGGLTIEETAQVLGISIATVKRKYRFGLAFITKELMLEKP
jgi:ECF sigma factor